MVRWTKVIIFNASAVLSKVSVMTNLLDSSWIALDCLLQLKHLADFSQSCPKCDEPFFFSSPLMLLLSFSRKSKYPTLPVHHQIFQYLQCLYWNQFFVFWFFCIVLLIPNYTHFEVPDLLILDLDVGCN
jgi:hypothetical protein